MHKVEILLPRDGISFPNPFHTNGNIPVALVQPLVQLPDRPLRAPGPLHALPPCGLLSIPSAAAFSYKNSFRELPVKEGDRAKESGEAECCCWFCQESLLFMKSLVSGRT